MSSAIFILLGLTAVIIGVISLTFRKTTFFNGLFYPLFVIGVIEVALGITLYIRTPVEIDRVLNLFVLEPEAFTSTEIPRMEMAMQKAVHYFYAEFVAIAMGFAFYFQRRSNFLRGLGLGLAIQSCALLAVNQFTEENGKIYLEFLYQASAKKHA